MNKIREKIASIQLTQLQIYLICFFVLTRLTILLFYDAYITDVAFYLDIAKQGLNTKAHAYQDFSFGYPPLALLFVYLPAWFSNFEFWNYWRLFRIQMFIIDLALFAGIFYFLINHLKIIPQKLILFIAIYCLVGFLQGHLLYDRLDLLIEAALFSLFYAFNRNPGNRWLLRSLSLIGMFIKFVPFLYALLLNLINRLREAKPSKSTPLSQLLILLKAGISELLLLIIPFILFISVYELTIAGGVFKDLNMHFQRGIQIESIWATPVLINKLIVNNPKSLVINNFGAQHIDDSQVPSWYLDFSKLTGIIILSFFGLYFFIKLRTQLKLTPSQIVPMAKLSGGIWLVLFCIFLSTQRVLSPQFFIWIMIPISLLLALSFDWFLFILAILTYTLTYIGFDICYWDFVNGNRFFILIVSLRNLSLVLLTYASLRHLKKSSIYSVN